MSGKFDKPIPKSKPLSHWQNITIEDTREKLVSAKQLDSKLIVVKPQYFLKNIEGAENDCYLREGATQLLTEAAQQLPKNYRFMIYDAWRSFDVQKSLFDQYYQELQYEYPNLSNETLTEITTKYVSLPSLNKKAPAPHITGGAIDLTLINEQGEQLAMGTDFDSFNEEASTRYYENLIEKGEILTSTQENYLINRRLLYHLMVSVGFTSYAHEWWHFDYGNQWWANQQQDRIAKYGLIQK